MEESIQSEVLKNSKKLIEKELNTLYGSHRWDYQLDSYSLANQQISSLLTIHYPKLVIKNEAKEHTIYDLYVRIQLHITYHETREVDNVTIQSIKGTRTTYTHVEWESGYTHSHLPKNLKGGYNNFCLGSNANPLPMSKAAFNMEPGFDSMLFEVFLIQLDRYLAWESKAGGPYMYMVNIEYPANGDDSSSIIRADADKLLSLYYNKIIDLPIDLVTDGNIGVILKLDKDHPNFITLMDRYTNSKGHLSPGRQVFTQTKDKNKALKLYLTMDKRIRMGEMSTSVGEFNNRKVNICVKRPAHKIVSNQSGEDLVANPAVIHGVANNINEILKRHSYEKEQQQAYTSTEVIGETVEDADEPLQYTWSNTQLSREASEAVYTGEGMPAW